MCAREVQRDRWKRRRVKSDSLRVKIMRGGILDGMRNCFGKNKNSLCPARTRVYNSLRIAAVRWRTENTNISEIFYGPNLCVRCAAARSQLEWHFWGGQTQK